MSKVIVLLLTYGLISAATKAAIPRPDLQDTPKLSSLVNNLLIPPATTTTAPPPPTAPPQHHYRPRMYSAADTFTLNSNPLAMETLYLNASNTTTCNSSAPWQGAASWAEVLQASRTINALCYVFFIPFVIWQGCLRFSLFRRNRRVLQSNTSIRLLYYLLALSFGMRAFWLLFEEASWCTLKDRDEMTHSLICPCFMILRVLNRLSMLFFYSAFSVIAIFWAEIMSQARRAALAVQNNTKDNEDEDEDSNNGKERNRGDASSEGGGGGSLLAGNSDSGQPVKDCCNPATLFTMLNVWVYIIEFVILWIEAFGQYDDATYGHIRDYNYICVSTFFLILTVAMLCIGKSMYHLMKNGISKIIISKMSIIMITCSLCFTLRSIILSWQPLTKHKIAKQYWEILYPTFVYPVPELVPALVVLITMAPKKSKSLGDDDLDDEGEEEEEDRGGCCCCCRSDGRRRWMSFEEEEEENNSTRFDSLLAFDVSNSVSSNESINGGGYSGNFSGIRKAAPQRSRGWF